MMISFYFTLLFFCVKQDFVTCVDVKMPLDFLTVALGASLTLNCTYHCSSGFVRGCWSKASDDSVCHGTIRQSSFCTVSLHLSNVSVEDLKKNYTCYTLQTDDVKLPQKTERIVILQLQAQTRAPNWTVILKTETKNAQTRAPNWTVIPKTETKNESLPTEPKDSSGGELTGIKLLAPVTVVVAIVLAVLAVYLGLNWNRQCWICKGESAVSRSISPLPPHSVLSPVKGPLSSQSERVTLRIPTPDNGSDTEVPYADIMITVRGVSTPELTQVGCLTPGDQKEWWGDESRSHLQASRSADRLHVPQPREVSRKMSTNSEYAVITYA